jgi:hypothetical protein
MHQPQCRQQQRDIFMASMTNNLDSVVLTSSMFRINRHFYKITIHLVLYLQLMLNASNVC